MIITSGTSSTTPTKISQKVEIEGEGEKKTAVTNTVKSDSVALTTATQEMKKTFGSSSASPVDIDRVNSVKKALADGSYSVNADKIAKKLIQLEKLMPQEDRPSP